MIFFLSDALQGKIASYLHTYYFFASRSSCGSVVHAMLLLQTSPVIINHFAGMKSWCLTGKPAISTQQAQSILIVEGLPFLMQARRALGR